MYFCSAKGAVCGDDLVIISFLKEFSLVEQTTNRMIWKMRRCCLLQRLKKTLKNIQENPHKGTIEGLYELKSYASTMGIPFLGQSLTRLSLLPSDLQGPQLKPFGTEMDAHPD